jgi:FkbM family methyltransferase
MIIFRKIKRELVVMLSKMCLKSARNDYFGLDLKFPILFGMGRGYVVPKEAWMGQCLRGFIETKKGCIIDVGVNVGVYLVKLKTISDDIEYIGFEPSAVCNFYTNELIRMNGFKRAKVLPLALSDELNVMTLYAGRLGDKSASLVYETKNLGRLDYSTNIVTVCGDDFINILKIDDISAIKIDVEGAELSVLNGLEKTIEKFRPYLYIEVWANYSDGEEAGIQNRISAIYSFITSKNYSILGVSHDRQLEKKESWSSLMDQYDPNYIFVPNELLSQFSSNINSIPSCDIRADNI